jgi:transposase
MRSCGPRSQQPPVVHTDDPGWRVGGEPAHLMACETDAVTVSQIRPRHRHDEVQEVIPVDNPGVMVTDRGRSDDAQAFANVRQQTCGAHLQRSIRDALATKTVRARAFGGLQARLQAAVQLWHADRDGPVPAFPTQAKALQEELPYQRRDRRLRDPDHHRLLNEHGWHHDRGNLQPFLADPRLEPTPRVASLFVISAVAICVHTQS